VSDLYRPSNTVPAFEHSACGSGVQCCCVLRYHLFHFWQNVFNDEIQVLDVAQQGKANLVLGKLNLH
jgi:hypothetical protein